MSKKEFILVLSLLLSGVSCTKNMDDYVSGSASDRIVTGILSYHPEAGRWEIRAVTPGSIDGVKVYIVRKYNPEISKTATRAVQATGRCYESSERQTGVPAGTALYYIEIESLGYIPEPPASIARVVDVIDVKYGEETEFVHNGRTFNLSITDIVDNLLDLSSAYMPDPEALNNVRIHACLRVETGGKVTRLRVIASPYRYKNDGTDMQHVRDLLEEWQSVADSQDSPARFAEQFVQHLGDGTLLESAPAGIYMAKAYSRLQHQQEEDKSLYRFIFIITG
jgi:hypothetical protein